MILPEKDGDDYADSYTVSWSSDGNPAMYKYWKTGQLGTDNPAITDGEPQIIEYRVIGTLVQTDANGNIKTDKQGNVIKLENSNYTSSNSKDGYFDVIEYGEFTEGSNEYSGDVTNTNTTNSICINVQFTADNGTETTPLNQEDVDALQESEVLPVFIKFSIEYSTDKANWTPLPIDVDNSGTGTNSVMWRITQDTYDSETPVFEDLARYDKDGNTIYYRVKETAAYYLDGTKIETDTDNDNTLGNFTVGLSDEYVDFTAITIASKTISIANAFATSSLTVTKAWDDSQDADKLRPDEIKVSLYKLDTTDDSKQSTLIDTVTINPDEDGNWSYTWGNLPVYNSASELIEYYVVEENSIDGYKTTYSSIALGDDTSEDPTAAKVTLTSDMAQTINIIGSHEATVSPDEPTPTPAPSNDSDDAKTPTSSNTSVGKTTSSKISTGSKSSTSTASSGGKQASAAKTGDSADSKILLLMLIASASVLCGFGIKKKSMK